MPEGQKDQFSGPVAVCLGRPLPEKATPIGYAALIEVFELKVPLPVRLTAIGPKHQTYKTADWQILTPRHAPEETLEGHLVFALKHEGLDLAVLKQLFIALSQDRVEDMVRGHPTGSYARRIWFLYEWLTGDTLDLPDAKSGRYVDAVDPKIQYGKDGKVSSRHRVRDNLPGTPDFCPLVYRTQTLEAHLKEDLKAQALQAVAKIPGDVLSRAAAFLLLKDSKSSHTIEGETPPQDRIQRWGRAIGEAGKNPLSRDELLRLQSIVMGNARFTKMGMRTEGGFVGEHERGSRTPLPDHISARPEALKSLIQGLIDFDQNAASSLDAIMAAAILAFGFVYIHPFEDGNGRIHRYLLHHVLTGRGFNPPELVFPVSSAILDRIADYRKTLESYSQRLLPLIEWKATEDMNVEILNDTDDFYRFFDATPHVEFLYECVKQTIEIDLPEEAAFLESYDRFRSSVVAKIEMPDSTVDLLFNFLKKNEGTLSKRAQEKEFSPLQAEEIRFIEAVYAETLPGSNR